MIAVSKNSPAFRPRALSSMPDCGSRSRVEKTPAAPRNSKRLRSSILISCALQTARPSSEEAVPFCRSVTDAERPPKSEDYPEVEPDKLVAGGAVFTPPGGMRKPEDPMTWWEFVPGANWRHPGGPDSDIVGKGDYPVVQVSYNDALAYAHWAGRELPTEEQLEFAARGGLDGKTYAWGDELTPSGKHMANTWQESSRTRIWSRTSSSALPRSGAFRPTAMGFTT
jgi:formylglycine-generating enzyme required for sulfatase activity